MKIAFLGDIALVGQFDRKINNSVDKHIKVLKKMLSGYDFIVANLESPLTEKKHSLVCKSMHLRSSIVNIDTLKKLGINAVSLANNHVLDFGTDGLDETIKCLEDAGIEWYGVKGKTAIISLGNEKASLSGFCCYSTNGVGYDRKNGISTLTYSSIEEQVKKDKKNNMVSLCSVHWGIEHTNYPSYEHICLAKKISGLNTVLIHGHHPHVIQGIAQYDDSLVAYSLGNALFGETESINGKFKVKHEEGNRKSFVLGIEILDGKIKNYEIQGFYISDSGIIEYDIIDEITEFSNRIAVCEKDVGNYECLRMEQYSATLKRKFGKHDLKWLLSRLNYYSVGAKITSKIHAKKYSIEKKSFM